MGATRVHGTVVSVPTAGLQVKLAITFVTGEVLNSSDFAYTTISGPAYYPLPWFCNKVAKVIRQWIFDAAGGDAALSPPGAATGVTVDWLAPTLSDTPGASRLAFKVGPTGITQTAGGAPVVIQSATIDNSTSWATPFGFEDGVSSIAASVAAGVATWTGSFQPRSLFPFPQIEDMGHERKVRSNEFTNIGGDGTVYYYDAGASIKVRSYKLLQQSLLQGGPSYPVGYFGSISGDRKTITLASTDETVSSGFGTMLYESSFLAAHQWVAVEGVESVARVKTVTSTTIVLYEPLSSAPTAGAEVYALSEAAAFDLEARRLAGYHLIWSNDESAQAVKWGAFSTYCRMGKGESVEGIDRPGNFPEFNWGWELAKRRRTGLTLP